jgi:hypothetical protein
VSERSPKMGWIAESYIIAIEDLKVLSVIGKMYLEALEADENNEYLTLPQSLGVQDVKNAVKRWYRP